MTMGVNPKYAKEFTIQMQDYIKGLADMPVRDSTREWLDEDDDL